MAGEEPVGAPLSKAAKRREPRLDLVVRECRELVEVKLGASDAQHVLGLAPREAESGQLLLGCQRNALTSRERDGVARGDAETVDETAAHGERGLQRHLL